MIVNEKFFEENHFGGSSFSAVGDLQKESMDGCFNEYQTIRG
jgi:hypothetical protein